MGLHRKLEQFDLLLAMDKLEHSLQVSTEQRNKIKIKTFGQAMNPSCIMYYEQLTRFVVVFFKSIIKVFLNNLAVGIGLSS